MSWQVSHPFYRCRSLSKHQSLSPKHQSRWPTKVTQVLCFLHEMQAVTEQSSVSLWGFLGCWIVSNIKCLMYTTPSTSSSLNSPALAPKHPYKPAQNSFSYHSIQLSSLKVSYGVQYPCSESHKDISVAGYGNSFICYIRINNTCLQNYLDKYFSI